MSFLTTSATIHGLLAAHLRRAEKGGRKWGRDIPAPPAMGLRPRHPLLISYQIYGYSRRARSQNKRGQDSTTIPGSYLYYTIYDERNYIAIFKTDIYMR